MFSRAVPTDVVDRFNAAFLANTSVSAAKGDNS
jgi:hypothetical protein